ncbi:MAG: Hpt domain-containing protein [Alcanivorax sp.]|jgi:HPt (histidine-containing phosphotransfer) domain-containing protein|uniref:Hpt domain-containing protein n=1 Tax=Alcanivorax TaxID=59753 RepID=UPI00235674CB|nr:Hpt domain-containing protein [Alcanivorax jadensis]|tara:strand:+ start:2606 stop:2944 length:339 start_codon:yes stop_codon:yes gene_type:complete
MQDSAILDDEVVTELQDVMGQDFSMLVDSFKRDGEQRLHTLASAYTAGDQETLRRQAHSFKGSSGNLGAVRVFELCMQLESLAREGELGQVSDLLTRLRDAFDQACDALRQI